MSYPSEELSADLIAKRKKVHAYWAAYADPPRLAWNPDTKQLTGRIEDYDVQVSLVSQMPHGELKDTPGWKTLVQVTDAKRLHGLATVHESATETLAKWLGLSDIQLGDSTLDKRYQIRGAAPSLVLAVLTAPAVKALLRSRDGVYLHHGSVRYATRGAATGDLHTRVKTAMLIADTLRQALQPVVRRLADQAKLEPTEDWHRNLPVFAGTVEGASVVMVRSLEHDGLYILASDQEDVLPQWRTRLQTYLAGGKPHGYGCVHLSEVDPSKIAAAVEYALEIVRIKADRTELERQKEHAAQAHWLEQARREWFPVSTDLALEVSRDPEYPAPRFDGSVRGVPVSARRHSVERDRYDVTVPIDPPLSARFSIRSKRRTSSKNPIRLGDPILDGMVCVSPHRFGNDTLEPAEVADIARAALCRDAVRADLLSLMETFPRTYICGEEIYVPVEQVSPERLANAIRDAVAVARALSKPKPEEHTP